MRYLQLRRVMSDKTKFMGLPVEGDVTYGGRYRAAQEPVENLYVYFKNAFDKGVKAVMWTQYTPGFNDGDPCEFTVCDARLTTNPLVADAWLEDTYPDMAVAYPGNEYDYYDEYLYEPWGEHPDGNHINDISIPVSAERFEDALDGIFGNDTKVVVTPERVVQFEYDCGY
jgi:hypothetical protein